MTLMLVLGLAAVFGGLVLAILVLAGAVNERQTVARSMAAIERFGAAAPLREQQLQAPFAERVLAPLSKQFESMGRRLTPEDRLAKIRRRLDLAGNPPGWDVNRVVGLKVLGLIIGFALGLLVPPLLGFGFFGTAVTVLVLAAVGWFGPTMWIYQIGYDRTERMQRDLPDALDLLTISVEAGLGFDAAMSQVAANTDGPLGAELHRVLQEMQIGTGRGDALRALSDRTDIEELRAFAGAMVQADALGVSMSTVLRVQSREMRVKRSQRAEEAAQKVPVKILIPLIFFIMPALFIVVLGPAAIQIFVALGGR